MGEQAVFKLFKLNIWPWNSDRSFDKWLAKLSPCRKVLGSAPLCFLTGTSAKWRWQTLHCRQRPLSPHIQVALETSVLIWGLARFQHVLKTTPRISPNCVFEPRESHNSAYLFHGSAHLEHCCVSRCVVCASAHVPCS